MVVQKNSWDCSCGGFRINRGCGEEGYMWAACTQLCQAPSEGEISVFWYRASDQCHSEYPLSYNFLSHESTKLPHLPSLFFSWGLYKSLNKSSIRMWAVENGLLDLIFSVENAIVQIGIEMHEHFFITRAVSTTWCSILYCRIFVSWTINGLMLATRGGMCKFILNGDCLEEVD